MPKTSSSSAGRASPTSADDDEYFPDGQSRTPTHHASQSTAPMPSISSSVRPSSSSSHTSHSSSNVAHSNSLKRKRGRVTPSQLAFLEAAYLADRSLDAARRREISTTLGMDERQTQIWFQNRRAKAKLIAQRAKDGLGAASAVGGGNMIGMPGAQQHQHPQAFRPASAMPATGGIGMSLGTPSSSTNPMGPNMMSGIGAPSAFDAIQATLQEDTHVLIGQWRRMNTGTNDLLVYLSQPQPSNPSSQSPNPPSSTNSHERSTLTLTYYVRCADVGFKMRLPVDSIVSAEYIPPSTLTPGSQHPSSPYPDESMGMGMGNEKIVLLLAKPPTFSREVVSRHGGAEKRTWRTANDWTEGAQASTCTRHEISAAPGMHGVGFGPAMRALVRAVSSSGATGMNSAGMPNGSSGNGGMGTNFFGNSPSNGPQHPHSSHGVNMSGGYAGNGSPAAHTPASAMEDPFAFSFSPSSSAPTGSANLGYSTAPSAFAYQSPMPHPSMNAANSNQYPPQSQFHQNQPQFPHHHMRSRSRSQPSMNLSALSLSTPPPSAFNYSQHNPHTPSIGPASAGPTMGSSGFGVDFDPFAFSLGGAASSVGSSTSISSASTMGTTPGTAGGMGVESSVQGHWHQNMASQQQAPQQQQGIAQAQQIQAQGQSQSQSDVSLLPDHLSSSSAGRPISSSSSSVSGSGSGSGSLASSGLFGMSSIESASTATSVEFAPKTTSEASSGSSPSPPAHAGPITIPTLSNPNGARGPRFMDIYSSQNLNLASYVLGSASGPTSAAASPVVSHVHAQRDEEDAIHRGMSVSPPGGAGGQWMSMSMSLPEPPTPLSAGGFAQQQNYGLMQQQSQHHSSGKGYPSSPSTFDFPSQNLSSRPRSSTTLGFAQNSSPSSAGFPHFSSNLSGLPLTPNSGIENHRQN